MCGIWGILSPKKYSQKYFHKISHRGPDNHKLIQYENISIGFHRLDINDLTENGDQPFILDTKEYTIHCSVNGEIYNYKDIVLKFNLEEKLKSKSDCEIIIYLFEMMEMDFLPLLNGEFAISIVKKYKHSNKIDVYLARDRFGIRPLFYFYTKEYLGWSSELKGIPKKFLPFSIQFPPRKWQKLVYHNNIIIDRGLIEWYSLETKNIYNNSEKNIKKTLKNCIKEMLISDVEIGALLSGGLDSSLVVSILSRLLHSQGKRMKTFSIGMKNSTDELYAKIVSEYCDTDHTHYELSSQDFIDNVPETIKAIETYDTTTVRASVGQYLISKFIKRDTNVKVLFIGDGSDELTSGYIYFHNSPSGKDMHQENLRLLNDIHYFDVLRADRGIAAHGLEARVPFLHHKFTECYLSIDPELRMPRYSENTNSTIEKWLLRKSFEGYLPSKVLWRKKEAFSDGVSSVKDSWYEIIKKETQKKYPNSKDSEQMYYKSVYDELFKGGNNFLYKWMPKWSNASDPSARVLDNY